MDNELSHLDILRQRSQARREEGLKRKAALSERLRGGRARLSAPIVPPSDDDVFQALFDQVSSVETTDWNANPILLENATRLWEPIKDTDDSAMPLLSQLDPLQERDVRTGVGRSRRLLHALLDIRMQRQPDQMSYPANQPFNTLLNNWKTSLYNLISPTDNPFLGLPGFVTDCYPTDAKFDYGLDSKGIAVVQIIVEIVIGG